MQEVPIVTASRCIPAPECAVQTDAFRRWNVVTAAASDSHTCLPYLYVLSKFIAEQGRHEVPICDGRSLHFSNGMHSTVMYIGQCCYAIVYDDNDRVGSFGHLNKYHWLSQVSSSSTPNSPFLG